MKWVMGIDTHKESFEVGVVDERSSEVDFGSFLNDEAGLEGARRWIQSHEGERIIGVECSGSYGAPIARKLASAGEDVKEVPPMLVHRERKKSPAKGKSDRVDAFAIARSRPFHAQVRRLKGSPQTSEIQKRCHHGNS